MNVVERFQLTDRRLLDLAHDLAKTYRHRCESLGIAPDVSRMVVSWGGGKDSTVALTLACAIRDLTGATVQAYTMHHPGLTPGVLANIDRISNHLGVAHEWRQFNEQVNREAPHESWFRLYRMLWNALPGHPRFMCIACNLGATTCEYRALTHHRPHFHVTGNPQSELDEFDRWLSALRHELEGQVAFPVATGNATRDYFRVWHAIYEALLSDISGIASSACEDVIEGSSTPDGPADALLNQTAIPQAYLHEYLYPLPSKTCDVGDIHPLNLMNLSGVIESPERRGQLLSIAGWQLPSDIPGGTESDCAFPSAIAHLTIERYGRHNYESKLANAIEVFRPTDEMASRARSWLESGRTEIEGRNLIKRLRFCASQSASAIGPQSTVAKRLADKLFPIR